MVQTNHNKVETAEGHTALLRAVKSRLLPMVSSKIFPTISRYAAVSVILHNVQWLRLCYLLKLAQMLVPLMKMATIPCTLPQGKLHWHSGSTLHCSNFFSKTGAFTLIWSGVHRAGSRRMVEALLLRKPANHHLLYRLQPIKSLIMGYRSEPTASGRLPARWTWPTSSRSSGVALTSSSPMIGVRTISTAPS